MADGFEKREQAGKDVLDRRRLLITDHCLLITDFLLKVSRRLCKLEPSALFFACGDDERLLH